MVFLNDKRYQATVELYRPNEVWNNGRKMVTTKQYVVLCLLYNLLRIC